MENTPENRRLVMRKLDDLAYMSSFPDTVEKLEAYAKAIMRIVSAEHIDWIVNRIADTCERFPMPVRVYQMYAEKYRPENEAEVEPMLQALGGSHARD